MKIQIFAVAFYSLALGACVTQQQQSVANTEAEATTVTAQEVSAAEESVAEMGVTAAVDETARERIICKDVVRTGTRFTEKSCRTLSEWKTVAEQGKDTAEHVQRRLRGL